MDSFDDAFGEDSPAPPTSAEKPSNGNGLLEDESDPAAEFLAREQSNFAGLEDEIPAVGAGDTETVTNGNGDVSNGNGMADDFGIGGDSNGLGLDLDDDFISGSAARPDSPMNGTGYQQNIFVQREEPEKIRIWREDQKRRLEVKDAEEEESKDKLKDAAKKELDDWYKNYDEQISKTRNTNRNAEQEGAAASDASPTEGGKDWERIANLCDFNPKASKQQKDISRMRSLILQLKQQPPSSRRQSSTGSSNAS